MAKRKRRGRAVRIILLLLLVLVGAVALHQRENIKSLQQAMQMTTDEIAQEMTENRDRLSETVAQSDAISVREMTDEEKQALRDGTKTRSELAADMVVPPENAGKAQEKYSPELSVLIAEAYILREEYTNEIEKMEKQGKEEYDALIAEGKTTAELAKWAGGYVTRAGKLEKECDARMRDLLDRLEKALKDCGEDNSLAKEVLHAYATEKSLTKSWYLAEMEKRGLLE